MTQTVTAIEAAQLLGVSERTMRTRLKAGRFPGAHKIDQGGGVAHWEIPISDLERDTGARLDRDKLALLATRHRGTSPADILTRLERLEAQVRTLERQLLALRESNGPVTRSEGQESALPVGGTPYTSQTVGMSPASAGAHGVAPASGYSLTYGRRDTHRGSIGMFRTRSDAARWLERHGVNSEHTPKSWPGWREVELTPAAVLALAISLYDPTNWRITWQLARCEDMACVCQETLPAQ